MIRSFGRKHVRHQIAAGLILLAVIMAAGCAPKVTGTIDVPLDDDMVTQIKKQSTIYQEGVPAWVLKGTLPATTDFSATVKITMVQGTRTIRGEITSPTTLWSQDPEHVGVIFYLCQPLSSKADRLSDDTVVYHGDGYPEIIVGQSYGVLGVLQPGWQDWPYVYVPSASDFKMTPKGK